MKLERIYAREWLIAKTRPRRGRVPRLSTRLRVLYVW